jgi:hypothetical protein
MSGAGVKAASAQINLVVKKPSRQQDEDDIGNRDVEARAAPAARNKP